MKRTKKQARRMLSVFLSVLMLISAWVFVSPDALPKATAESGDDSTLLGRFFSTSDWHYDAVSESNVVTTASGTDPSYDELTGMTTIPGDGYLQINKQNLYAGVNENTGLSIAATYYSSKDEPHEHLISSGASAYGSGTARHFYIAGTYLGSGTRYRGLFMEWIGPGGDNQKTIRCYADGFTFAANTTYNIVVTFSVKEGVVYTINGKRYAAYYMDSSYAAQKENIRLFLNDVAEYQYHYIGRSRWTADGNFGGGIKDLRLYRENLNASPLLARFFSTNSVWYEAVTDDYEGLVSAGNGSAPSYNSTTGYTTLYSNNYLKVSSPGLFAGVTPETGLTLSFSYRPTQDEHYVQLMSFGKNVYGSGTDDHFYIGATFHETYKDSNMRNPLIFEWRYGDSSKVCTWPQGLAFSAGTTYDVEIAISQAEGVVYTVNGIKYTARYYYGTKADISTFLNVVAGYQYGYIGRSRWTGDTQFAGDIKDLRFYKTVVQSTPLLGRFFSTSNVWHDAVTKNDSGLTWEAGQNPSYNAATGFTYLNGNNNNSYVSITNPAMFTGVNAETGLTIAFTYQPMQGDRYVQLLSFGYDTYGTNQARHLYVGATYHASRGGDTTPLFMDWQDSGSTAHIKSTPQGLRFEVNKIYDVIISISATEGVTYVVNGVKYNTVYEGSNFENEKQYITAFLNDVSNYQRNYIGRSRWQGDKSFDGNIKDLRFYGCALLEKQNLIDYNIRLFDDPVLGFDTASLAEKLTQSGSLNQFTAPAYHYSDTATGAYSNLLYASTGTPSIRGADNSDAYKNIGGTNLKFFNPFTVVMVHDGQHDAYAPIQMESIFASQANISSSKIRYAASNNGLIALKNNWQGYLDADWTKWAGDHTEVSISSSGNAESDYDPNNRDTPRFFWNAQKYIGSGNDTSYFENIVNVGYDFKVHYDLTIGTGSDDYQSITTLADNYVINYKPIYNALPNALACYNDMTENSWMFTEESINRAKATLVQIALANPKDSAYTYASDTSAAVAACGASIVRANVLLGEYNPSLYTYGYEGLQLVKKQGTVTFLDDDGTPLLAAQTYDYGTAAEDITTPADPVKQQTNEHVFTFEGWDPALSVVNAPAATYTATYSSALRDYSVTLSADGTGYTVTQDPPATVNYNGTASFAVTLAEGYTNSAAPVCTATDAGTVTTSKSGNVITYTVPNITASTVITLGAATLNSYSVTLNSGTTGYTVTQSPAATVSHGGSVTFTIELDVAYNSSLPQVTATVGTVSEPERSGDELTYTVSDITAATAITVGSVAINTYTVTFEDWDGTELKTGTVNHGDNATPPADPTRSPDGTNHYSFDGWDAADYSNITAPKTITASYTAEAHAVGATGTNATCVAPAVCGTCGESFGSVDPDAHDWGAPAYQWAEDNSTCTATRSCSRTGCPVGTQSETVTVGTEQTKDPTCTENGETTYTATFTNAAFETQVKKIALPAKLNHQWDYESENVTYVWNDDCTACVATVPCVRGDITTTINASGVTHSTTKTPTCKEKGEETYVAVFGYPYLTSEKKVELDYTAHVLGALQEARPGANCQSTGLRAYYQCTVCEKYFADSEAQTELTALELDTGVYGPHDPQFVDAVPGIDCQHYGTIAHYKCSVCQATFSDAEGTTPISDLSDNTYGDHSFTTYNSNNDATCMADGTKTALCDYNCGTEDTVADVGSKIPHSFTTYNSDNNATCMEDGTKTALCDYNCGTEDTVADVGSKIPHSFTTYNSDNNATCMADGTKTALCDYNCGTEDTVADVGSKIPHSFTTYNSDNNATCMEDGTKTALCDYNCGTEDTVADVGSKIPHSFTAYTSNNDATCLADGTKTALCDYNCGTTDVLPDENSRLPHRFTQYTSNNDATCTADGTKTAYCDNNCGTSDTVTDPGSKIPHAFTNYVSDDNATCLANATETAACDYNCGNTDTREIENTKLTHLFTNYVYNDDATCFENGTETALCDRGCGTTDERTAENTKLTHQFTNYVYNDDATCFENGTETALCDHGCGTTDERAAENTKLTHQFTNYVYNNDATCSEDGTETALCDHGCGTTDERTAENSKLAHTYSILQSDDEGHWYKCANCDSTTEKEDHTGTATCMAKAVCEVCETEFGEKDPNNHTGNNTTSRENEVAANCTDGGSYLEVVTCECGVVISSTEKATAALGHLFGSYVADNNATCEEDGTETASCTRCDATDSRSVPGSKLGHVWGDWVVTKAATCTETGRKTRTCTRDESHTLVEATPMIPHVDGNNDALCDVCGRQMSDHQHKDSDFDNVCDDCGQTIDTGFRCSLCSRNDQLKASGSNGFVMFAFTAIHLFVHAFQSFFHIVLRK